jgi:CheY-like chemotaxis protein
MPCILVVEDDSDTRDALRDVLASEGHEVHVASDGESAIRQLLADEPPTVILLDRWIPHVNGQEMLDWLEEHPRFSRVRVIVTTADEAKFQHARASIVLRKPFDLDNLLTLVRNSCTDANQDSGSFED